MDSRKTKVRAERLDSDANELQSMAEIKIPDEIATRV